LHIDPYIVLGSAVVGLLAGMTGAGGGALMTPMLILIGASQLVGTDLTQAVPLTLAAALGALIFGHPWQATSAGRGR
jgi:uncharacterized protein